MSKQLEELLYEADSFFLREEVLQVAKDLQEEEPDLSIEDACSKAYMHLREKYSQGDVSTHA